ncbi:MAG: cation transporting ATPase C-terminal domain-containing protein [Methylibium sp.]|nr:cation transporting ATPase C-terminal domain-containing protein [Methylibium sp.]
MLLQLLIDPACAMVFEAESEDGDVIDRPPRPASSSPFAVAALGYAVLQGLGLAGVLLAGYAVLISQGFGAAQARSVVFGTLLIAVMLLIMANRDTTRPALMGFTDANAWLWRMAAAVGLLLVAMLEVPWLRQVMGLALPGATGLAAGAGLLGGCVVWLELLRLARSYPRGTRLGA